MNSSEKLRLLMIEHSGNVKSFCRCAGIPYTTVMNSIRTEEKLGGMPIRNFAAIAHALGMTTDELIAELCYNEVEP